MSCASLTRDAEVNSMCINCRLTLHATAGMSANAVVSNYPTPPCTVSVHRQSEYVFPCLILRVVVPVVAHHSSGSFLILQIILVVVIILLFRQAWHRDAWTIQALLMP